jgi:hypothetical protein
VSLCRVAQDKGGVDGRSHRPPDVADGDDTSKPLFFRVPSSAESASATPGCERDNESLLMILPHEPRRPKACTGLGRRGSTRAAQRRIGSREGRIPSSVVRTRHQRRMAGRKCGVGAQRENAAWKCAENVDEKRRKKPSHETAVQGLCDETECGMVNRNCISCLRHVLRAQSERGSYVWCDCATEAPSQPLECVKPHSISKVNLHAN